MTRDEALRIAHEKWARPKIKCSESIVDTLTALGILKLDEPKSGLDILKSRLVGDFGYNCSGPVIKDIERVLNVAGLRIVEK